MNKKGFAISGIIYSILILFLLLIFSVLAILGSRKLIIDKFKSDTLDKIYGNELESEKTIYRDSSGANSPELLDNMIPIKYDGENWLYADVYKEWYDYDKKEWANAVILRNDVIKDISNNHNDITITDKYTNKNGMAYFDGVDDYLDLKNKNYDFGKDASMVLRFKLHSFGATSQSQYVLFGNCENSGFEFRITKEGRIDFVLFNENLNKYIINYGPDIELEKWYTLVGTYDGSTINFYVDGKLYVSISSPGEIKPSTVQFILGANPQPNNTAREFANITVSNAMVYDRTLSEKEIIDNFSNEINEYNTNDLLFGYEYFGSTRDYYKTDYINKGNEVISESDIALWYVWIPRYTYTIFNGNNGSVEPLEIQIKFESGTNSSGTVECVDNVSGSGESSETCTDSTNGSIVNGTSTYTHPAFTFGTQELTGFWMGKFEVSGSTNEITIKPNVSSLIELNVSTYFTAIQNMSAIYSLNGDSHMMKNMEWGAVAYLSHSKYGTCTNGKCVEVGINNNSNYITGCGANRGESASTNCNSYDTKIGMQASTTQNIYGVYDMKGSAFEYVMANVVDNTGKFNSISTGFTQAPDSKYYDSYTYGILSTTYSRGKLGDATKETLKTFGNQSSGLYHNGWYDNYTYFPHNKALWMSRGCSHLEPFINFAGLFAFGHAAGKDAAVTTRAVLVK